MKDNDLVTEISVFTLNIPIAIEYEKGYKVPPEQLALMHELALKKYLKKPIEERIQMIQEAQVADYWAETEACSILNQLEEADLACREVMDYLYDSASDEFDDSDFVNDLVNQTELIEDDCG